MAEHKERIEAVQEDTEIPKNGLDYVLGKIFGEQDPFFAGSLPSQL